MIENLVHDVGFFDVGTQCPDLVIEKGDLKGEKGFETSALISLFSDRFVPTEDLPDGEESNRGWWGDEISEPPEDQIGSKIWTTDRSKTTLETASQLEEFGKSAFQWMIDDGIAKKVETSSEIINKQEIRLSIEITKPDGNSFFFRFLWDGQLLTAQQRIPT